MLTLKLDLHQYKATVLFALIFLVCFGVSMVNSVSANPMGALYPRDPQNQINIDSPYWGETCNTNSQLNFKVDLSDWSPVWPSFNPDYSFSSTIMCNIDGNIVWSKTLNIHSKDYNFSYPPQEFSVPLNGLANGVHNITVEVTTNGSYWHADQDRVNHELSQVYNSSSVKIYVSNNPFAINPLNNSSLLITVVSITIAGTIIAVAGVLVYHFKHAPAKAAKST
jgi:hypothetical protein